MAKQAKSKASMKKEPRKSFKAEINIPEGFDVNIEKNKITMKKDSKELKRTVDKDIRVSKEGDKIILTAENARRNEKRKFGSTESHINNMIEGLSTHYEYELEICNVHFPITVTFDKSKSEFIIKNLLGEKYPRIIKVSKNVEVEIKNPHIKIKSYDLEAAGQAAANLEKITRVRNRDRNKFQDGIFITKKPGRSFL